MISPRIFLTGHRGFIGSALQEVLAERFGDNFAAVRSDLRRVGDVAAEFAAIPGDHVMVLHLATVNRRNCRSYDAYAANCAMLMNLIRATNHFPRRHFLFASSTDVFGHRPPRPLADSSPHQPDDWYGLSKSSGEWILRHENVDHAVFRLPGVFGARANERSLLRQLLDRGLSEGHVTLNARGEPLRDFLYLEDLQALILDWLDAPRNGSWNIVSGHSARLGESLAQLRKLSGATFEIQLQETKGPRDFDLVFDSSKLEAAFPRTRIRPAAQVLESYVSGLKTLHQEVTS